MGIFDRKPNVEKLAAEKDVEGLIEALQHKDSGVRRAATEALERIVEQLTQVLKDRSIIESPLRVSPRMEAAIKLGKIGDRRAIQPLLDVFISESESDTLRALTLEALGNIGGEEVRQGLINAFKKGSDKLREGILQFLEKDKLEKTGLSRNALYGIIGISEEELSLMDKAKAYYKEGSTYWNKRECEKAVAKWKEAARLNPRHPRVHSALGQVYVELGDIHEAEIEFRKQIEVNPEEFYSHAILSIIYGAVDDRERAREEENLAMNTSDYRNNPVFITRDYADKIQSLVQENGRAIECLIQDLETSYYSRRIAAMMALGAGYSKDSRAVDSLIKALKDEEGMVRAQAATVLGIYVGFIKDARVVEPLIQALKDNNYHVRENAAEALGRIGDARAVEPLILALKDEVGVVRGQAVTALGFIKDARAVEPLIQTLKDENSGVRIYAAEALGKIGDARAVEPLILALKDDSGDVRVRGAAKEALEKLEPKKN